MRQQAIVTIVVALVVAVAAGSGVQARSWQGERIKDIASVAGVRDNQLVGYGLVVGLNDTGDQLTQTPFTAESLRSLLSSQGVQIPPDVSFQSSNVAAVTVTAVRLSASSSGSPREMLFRRSMWRTNRALNSFPLPVSARPVTTPKP